MKGKVIQPHSESVNDLVRFVGAHVRAGYRQHRMCGNALTPGIPLGCRSREFRSENGATGALRRLLISR